MTNFTYTDVLKYVLDLPAQDIWRSRWAGIPSYNDIRSECGLIRATDFDEFSDAIDPQNIEKLKSVYRNVDDVDLYVGGLLERNYPGAKVGTTFFWIFIQQLLRFRQCDRFWYEHPEAGFTKIQLKIIKGVTLSSIMCETGNNIQSMQVEALQPPKGINFPINCQFIQKLDFSRWLETTYEDTTFEYTTYEEFTHESFYEITETYEIYS
ncbi:peroxidase-like [Diorhabda carinulata]|uniref:peroxidase-like n=1 Tax=Diorhabda carinulata TaxID=1163345 RepID=UPI0025A2A58B|nr:peroxidase-like [Diorhabda carinulata]